MKILVNDGMSEEGAQILRDAGHTVYLDKIPQEELTGRIAEFDAIVVRSATKVRQDVIDAGIPNLKAVVRGGVGVDNIDVKYAEEKGLTLDKSQIQPVGAGIREPFIAKPRNMDEARQNMRVEFRLLRVTAEAATEADFDF